VRGRKPLLAKSPDRREGREVKLSYGENIYPREIS
jgi:hypothetical protein